MLFKKNLVLDSKHQPGHSQVQRVITNSIQLRPIQIEIDDDNQASIQCLVTETTMSGEC